MFETDELISFGLFIICPLYKLVGNLPKYPTRRGKLLIDGFHYYLFKTKIKICCYDFKIWDTLLFALFHYVVCWIFVTGVGYVNKCLLLSRNVYGHPINNNYLIVKRQVDGCFVTYQQNINRMLYWFEKVDKN